MAKNKKRLKLRDKLKAAKLAPSIDFVQITIDDDPFVVKMQSVQYIAGLSGMVSSVMARSNPMQAFAWGVSQIITDCLYEDNPKYNEDEGEDADRKSNEPKYTKVLEDGYLDTLELESYNGITEAAALPVIYALQFGEAKPDDYDGDADLNTLLGFRTAELDDVTTKKN